MSARDDAGGDVVFVAMRHDLTQPDEVAKEELDESTMRRASLPLVHGVAVEVVGGASAGQVVRSVGERLAVGSAPSNDLVLADRAVSRYHLEMTSSPYGVRVVDLGSTNGTWAGGLRLHDAEVGPDTELQLGESVLRVSRDVERAVAVHAGSALAGIVGESSVMRRTMAEITRLAAAQASVLVTGESGTGKELAARALHDLGPRRGGPFVTVDCGAVSPTLIASELFGHERGAFTGADRTRPGAFEAADGGTIFLDEIGELPPAIQTTLLGVIERRRFRRVGGTRDIECDVRVVSATNRDLRREVNAGRFRADLYYRIAVVTLSLPPLRERPEDLVPLVDHFARALGVPMPPLTEEEVAQLRSHAWPGNVRELRNWVEARLAMGRTPELVAARTADAVAQDPTFEPLLDQPWRPLREGVIRSLEERYYKRLLTIAKGNVSEVSRLAQIDRSHVISVLRRLGLK